MPHEQPTSDEPTTAHDAAARPQPLGDEPLAEQEAWPEEAEELPARPRRRVLTPLPLALLAALAIAGGFIAGVLVEKGQGGGVSSGGAGAGAGAAFASRLASLRGGTSSGGAGSARSSSSSTGSGSAATGAASGTPALAGAAAAGGAAGGGAAGGSGGSATVGQVAFASKGTLYLTTSEGNTVKVTAAPGASVTRTVKASIKAIHPGETVLVAGASAADGAISASSIRIGSIAGGLGGASLFGGASGSGASGAASGSGSGAATSGAGEPQLFGKG